MADGIRHKLAFHTSVGLFNIIALAIVVVAYTVPFAGSHTVAAAARPPLPTIRHRRPAPEPPAVKRGIPARVVVPAVGLEEAVATGHYNASTGQWTLSPGTVYYASPTVPVNDRGGTTLIYGHNRWGAFRDLHALQPGDSLTVFTKNGLAFRYVLRDTRQVSPRSTGILRRNGQPTVILQTCGGAWSQYRQMFIFQLTSINKPRDEDHG